MCASTGGAGSEVYKDIIWFRRNLVEDDSKREEVIVRSKTLRLSEGELGCS